MGYSIYWKHRKSFDTNQWLKIVNHFNTNLNDETVDLDHAFFTDGEIFFNGAKGGTCETFCLTREKPSQEFNFCKTQELPYDKVIWKLLKFVKEEVVGLNNPDFEISNDNGEEIV